MHDQVADPALGLPEAAETGLGVLPWILVLIAVWDTAEGWWRLRAP